MTIARPRMFRLLLWFMVLFVGAVGLIALLPKPLPEEGATSKAAVALRAEADPPGKPVRVVYPPTSGMVEPSPTAVAAQEPTHAVAAVSPLPGMPGVVATAADTIGSAGSTPPAAVPSPPAGIPAALPTDAKIDINTASVDALDQIPGAGRVGRAIASRRPYRSVEDLLSKRVLRKSVYDRIKDQVAAKWDVAGAQ